MPRRRQLGIPCLRVGFGLLRVGAKTCSVVLHYAVVSGINLCATEFVVVATLFNFAGEHRAARHIPPSLLGRPPKRSANGASDTPRRPLEQRPHDERSGGEAANEAAARQQTDGIATVAEHMLRIERQHSNPAVAEQGQNTAHGGSLTANGDIGQLSDELRSATEAVRPSEQDQAPVRSMTGSRHKNTAIKGSPRTSAKQKGQQTMQSFFTRKPSS